MTDLAHGLEATPDNYSALVLENSGKGLVLAHFWSPRAGPCLLLMPRLQKLAREYRNRFLLVGVNTDRHPRLARELGVVSVPTVRFFRHGRIVHSVHGAESESAFRAHIDRFLPPPATAGQSVVLQAYREGDLARASRLLAEAALEQPDNPRIALDLAKLLIMGGEYGQAEDLLTAQPPEALDSEGQRLLAHASLLRTAQAAPSAQSLQARLDADPADCEARYQMAALKLTMDDFEGALAELLEITRRDRAFRSDAGRKGLIALFSLLGDDHELTRRYRALLTEVMH